MTRTVRKPPPLIITAAYLALGVGSVAGLSWLAPLEYGTGRWLGLGQQLAAAVPALIDSYVVLSVLTARDRRYSLTVAGLSGFVGQLHAAGVLPATDPRVRGAVAGLAAVIAVAVTARLKPLVVTVVAAERARLAAVATAATEAVTQAELAAVTAEQAAERERLATADLADEMAAKAEARRRPPVDVDGAAPTAARRPTTTAKPQVKRHGRAVVGLGLTDAETDVLAAMLGRGEMSREAVILASGRPLGTVKAVLTKLARDGRIEAVSGKRGRYVAVEPDVAVAVGGDS